MENLSQIVTDLQNQRKRMQHDLGALDRAILVLRRLREVDRPPSTGTRTGRPRRTMSVAGRKRIAAAQRARWGKFKQQQHKAA